MKNNKKLNQKIMNTTICCIPADNQGNKLWLKEFKEENGRLFLKYKSTYNDMPFSETELFLVDANQNLAIIGDNSKVLYRFSINWLKYLQK